MADNRLHLSLCMGGMISGVTEPQAPLEFPFEMQKKAMEFSQIDKCC